MQHTVVTPPAEEPVTLAEAKAHLRVDIPDDDALISGYLVAARRWCEKEIRRSFVNTTWQLSLDGFPFPGWALGYQGYIPGESPFADTACLERNLANPGIGGIRLPRAAVVSVSSLKYVDVSGVLQTLDPTLYQVEPGSPGHLNPAYGRSWPTARRQRSSVLIQYVAGYGTAADVPEDVKLAIKVLLTQLYENRGEATSELPAAVKWLLSSEEWGSYS